MVCLRNALLATAAAVAYAAPAAKTPKSVPIAIGGKEASISEEFIAQMKPDYDGT